MSKSTKPILVTGSHRSGTTWVGKILASSSELVYISELFRPTSYRPEICKVHFYYWFTYITERNETQYYTPIKNLLNLQYNLFEGFRNVHSIRNILHISKEYFKFFYSRYISHSRVLIKDPIAIFSAGWLAKRFNMDVVVLIRHPAAFVSSLKRLNWTFPFSHFLEQRWLMKDYLYPFETEIKEFANHEHNIIDQGILLWRIIYYMVNIYRDKYPNWIFKRHEDLSMNPVKEFEKLFARLSLEYTPKVRKIIKKYSSTSNPSEVPKGIVHQLMRNSKANIKNWKHRLKQSEVTKIKEGTKDISSLFYSEKDWL